MFSLREVGTSTLLYCIVLYLRELGTPSSSTLSYCHFLPDRHSWPHLGDLQVEFSAVARYLLLLWPGTL